MTEKYTPENSEVAPRPQDNSNIGPELPENIPPDLKKILDSEKKISPELLLQIAIRKQSVSGPLPHPEILQGYDNIQEGFADRVIRMAEIQIEHRHKMEERELEADIEITKRNMEITASEKKTGQYLAFLIALALMGCGILFAKLGGIGYGTTLITTTIAGLVSIFITGKYKEKKEREAETKQIAPSDSEKKDSKTP